MLPFLFAVGLAMTSMSEDGGAPPPAACTLSPGDLTGRLGEIEEIFTGSEETRELADGYEFRFPGNGDWAERLLGLIRSERHCCQFLAFELAFEPQQGPVWFRVRGSQEIKAFIGGLLEES